MDTVNKTPVGTVATVGAAAAASPPLPLAVRARRGAVGIFGEKAIEMLIRLCGISSIVFIFAIFFFVFREAVPILGKLDIGKFLFTQFWYPTSLGTPRFGVGALILGTASVTSCRWPLPCPSDWGQRFSFPSSAETK